MIALIRESTPGPAVLSVRQPCAVLSVSRAPYSRYRHRGKAASGDPEVRRHWRRRAKQGPSDGERRLPRALRREGHGVKHKRGGRCMREEPRLCRRRKRGGRPPTSRPGVPVYPTLLPPVSLTGLDPVGQADMTDIRLPGEVVDLAVGLDAFSRRCRGWALERSVSPELSLRALRVAVAARPVAPGLIHHSDQGVQYASTAYTDLLRAARLRVSRSRPGPPSDNAKAEGGVEDAQR